MHARQNGDATLFVARKAVADYTDAREASNPGCHCEEPRTLFGHAAETLAEHHPNEVRGDEAIS
jgi:hypothetical protein